jgi:hypothetical protein
MRSEHMFPPPVDIAFGDGNGAACPSLPDHATYGVGDGADGAEAETALRFCIQNQNKVA